MVKYPVIILERELKYLEENMKKFKDMSEVVEVLITYHNDIKTVLSSIPDDWKE